MAPGNKMSLSLLGLMGGGPHLTGGGFALPFSDTFTRADGALGAPWLAGTTWAIVGGKAVNTPTTGAELLTDPGLEANYTAGKCDTLSKIGSPTLVQSADVHGGSKAQQFTATVANDRVAWLATAAPIAFAWYVASCYAKQTAGAAGTVHAPRIANNDGVLLVSIPIVSASYALNATTFRSPSTATLSLFMREMGSSFDTVLLDDGSIKALSLPTLFAPVQSGATHVTVSAAATIVAGTQAGVFCNLDSVANPQNFVVGYHDGTKCVMEKAVAGVYTTLVSVTTAYSAGAAVKIIRPAGGNVFQLWYGASQVGTDQTIADAGIIGNTYHGLFSSYSGNTLDSFSAIAS